MNIHHYDIAILGGGMGGCAAALAACDAGLRVVLTEETDWVGGQMTSQGVSALDEHANIETFGGTRLYTALRDGIRAHYMREYGAPPIMNHSVLGPNRPLNPGNGWVSRLCFEPRVGLAVLMSLLQPHLDTGRLTLLHNTVPTAADVRDGQVLIVTVRTAQGDEIGLEAACFLDATELGDLLPLTGTAYVTGAESQAQTGEPRAPLTARPGEIQAFTACFAVEYCPGEHHVIPQPDGYAHFRDSQPFTLAPVGRDGQPVVYEMFAVSEQGNLPFWSYRRIYDGALLGGHDIALINWGSIDYYGASLIDVSPAEKARALDEARRLSLSFLHWLQTECPRDDGGGLGYPELRLRPDVMGTTDGLSKAPYIRESRRIVPLRQIVEQDIAAEFNPGSTARHMPDSVGLGWYAMDVHACVGSPTTSLYAPTKPFQIPLGALIPRETRNLIAACKNIGTTHLTNGAYRLHPTEWNIGESAGALAACCVELRVTPHQVAGDPALLEEFQRRLTERGIPLAW